MSSPPVENPNGSAFGKLVLLVNLLPVLGILFFGWGAVDLVSLYWGETGILGLIALLRIGWARHVTGGSRAGVASRILLSCFFIVHFGAFMAAHGVAVALLLLAGISSRSGGNVAIDSLPSALFDQIFHPVWFLLLATFLLQHLWEFKRDYLGREQWKKARIMREMSRPYDRVIIMHLTIIFGALPILFGPRYLALLLIALKLYFERNPVPLKGRKKPDRKSEPDPPEET